MEKRDFALCMLLRTFSQTHKPEECSGFCTREARRAVPRSTPWGPSSGCGEPGGCRMGARQQQGPHSPSHWEGRGEDGGELGHNTGKSAPSWAVPGCFGADLSAGPSLAVEPGVRGRLESAADDVPVLRGRPHRLLHLGAALGQVTPPPLASLGSRAGQNLRNSRSWRACFREG